MNVLLLYPCLLLPCKPTFNYIYYWLIIVCYYATENKGGDRYEYRTKGF